MSTSEFANAKSGTADTQLRPPQGAIKSGQEDRTKIKQPPILSLRMAGQEARNKVLPSQNPGASLPQIHSPTANNQQTPYPPAPGFYQQGIGFNPNQGGYGLSYNSYPREQQPLFSHQPPSEMQDIHPSTNFYRTEMEVAPKVNIP